MYTCVYLVLIVLFVTTCAGHPSGKKDVDSEASPKDVYNDVASLLSQSSTDNDHNAADEPTTRHRHHRMSAPSSTDKKASRLVKESKGKHSLKTPSHTVKTRRTTDIHLAKEDAVKEVLTKRRNISENALVLGLLGEKNEKSMKLIENIEKSNLTEKNDTFNEKSTKLFENDTKKIKSARNKLKPKAKQLTYPQKNKQPAVQQSLPYYTYPPYYQAQQPQYYNQYQNAYPNLYSNPYPNQYPNTQPIYYNNVPLPVVQYPHHPDSNTLNNQVENPSYTQVMTLQSVEPPSFSWNAVIEYPGMDPIYISDKNYTDNPDVEVIVHPAPVSLPGEVAETLPGQLPITLPGQLPEHLQSNSIDKKKPQELVDNPVDDFVLWKDGVAYVPLSTTPLYYSSPYLNPYTYSTPIQQWTPSSYPYSQNSVPYAVQWPNNAVPYVAPAITATASVNDVQNKDIVEINVIPYEPAKSTAHMEVKQPKPTDVEVKQPKPKEQILEKVEKTVVDSDEYEDENEDEDKDEDEDEDYDENVDNEDIDKGDDDDDDDDEEVDKKDKKNSKSDKTSEDKKKNWGWGFGK